MPLAAQKFGKTSNERRGSAHKRGYDAGHRARRDECLLKAGYVCQCPGCPQCVSLEGKPCVRLATVADHIIPHRGNRPRTLQAMPRSQNSD